MAMNHSSDSQESVRPLDERLRGVVQQARTAAGMSLSDLGERTGISPSTLSRLENGERRLAIDMLETIASGLQTTVHNLIADAERTDRLLLPVPEIELDDGSRALVLRTEESGRQLLRMLVPQRRPAERQEHPGTEWLHVLRGRLWLAVGDREIVVEAGRTAQFDCTLPHAMGGDRGPADILSRFEPGAHRHGATPKHSTVPRRPTGA